MMETETQHISLQKAAKELEVTVTTISNYSRDLGMELQRFHRDKRKYLKIEDFEKIKEAILTKRMRRQSV